MSPARGWAWLSWPAIAAVPAGAIWGARGVAVVAVAAVVVTAGRGLVECFAEWRRLRALERIAARHREHEIRRQLERHVLTRRRKPSEWHRARRPARG